MPRVYQRKTDRVHHPQATLVEAVQKVLSGESLRLVARQYRISHVTLFRKLKSFSMSSAHASSSGLAKPRVINRIFNNEEEDMFSDYVTLLIDGNHKISHLEMRSLAYQCLVEKCHKTPPKVWTGNQMAGKDWLLGFFKRNPLVYNRVKKLHPFTVDHFRSHCTHLVETHQIQPQNIYSMGKTEILSSLLPTAHDASKRKPQVSVSRELNERAALISLVCAANAAGHPVPSMFLFASKTFRDKFMHDGPSGCVGRANSAGWMKPADYKAFINHLSRHVIYTEHNKCLLIVDWHSAYVNVLLLDLLRAKGILLLFSPEKDDCRPFEPIFEILRQNIQSQRSQWDVNNLLDIDAIPKTLKQALPYALTKDNIQLAFSGCNIPATSQTEMAPHDK